MRGLEHRLHVGGLGGMTGGGGGGGGKGFEQVICWDGKSQPDVTKIPAGVTVQYADVTYIGTLAASDENRNKIFLVYNGGLTPNAYDEYYIVSTGDEAGWVTIAVPSDTWHICHGAGRVVAVGAYDSLISRSRVIYSDDGETWNEAEMPSARNWADVAYGNGIFVAIARNAAVCAYSTDGINWIERNMGITDTEHYTIEFCGNKFYSPGFDSNKCAYSSDGIVWNEVVICDRMVSTWTSVAYGNNTIVISAGDITTNFCVRSTDGVNWSESEYPAYKGWKCTGYGDGVFVSLAGNNVAYSTDNGASWTLGTLPVSKSWEKVLYCGDRFIAIADADIIITSTDGINWTEENLSAHITGRSITYFNDKVIITGIGSIIEIYNDSVIPFIWEKIGGSGSGGSSLNLESIVRAYDDTLTYSIGDMVSHNDRIYVANSDNITGEWDNSKWNETDVGAQIKGKANAINGGSAVTLTYWATGGETGTITFYGKITPAT